MRNPGCPALVRLIETCFLRKKGKAINEKGGSIGQPGLGGRL